MAIDPELLMFLRCPETRAPLIQDGDALVSTHPGSRRRYGVEDGIPNMIVEDSEVMPESDWASLMVEHGVKPIAADGDS